MWLEGPLQRVFILSFSVLVFPWVTFAQLNMNSRLLEISPLPQALECTATAHRYSPWALHVTMETWPLVLSMGETSKKHLCCPWEQLEPLQCSWLAHTSLPIMWAAKRAPLHPPALPKTSSHPSNGQTGTPGNQHSTYLTRKVAAWAP